MANLMNRREKLIIQLFYEHLNTVNMLYSTADTCKQATMAIEETFGNSNTKVELERISGESMLEKEIEELERDEVYDHSQPVPHLIKKPKAFK